MDLYEPHANASDERVAVGHGHELWVSRSGTQGQAPAVYLHGGPGVGSSPEMTRLFDPRRWDLVRYDQRGAGASTPAGGLDHNTTWDLVEDLEVLRERAGFESWTVVGGSWGSTLALAYCSRYPERVDRMLLRGVFLSRRQETDWLFSRSAGAFRPDTWRQLAEWFPGGLRQDLLEACWSAVVDAPDEDAAEVARRFVDYENSLCRVDADYDPVDASAALQQARIELHYMANECFLDVADLFARLSRTEVETHIVQGLADLVCPPATAHDVAGVLPSCTLELVAGGHSAFDPPVAAALRRKLDEWADR